VARGLLVVEGIERDLAALARAGFSYEVALAVIDAERPEDLAEPD